MGRVRPVPEDNYYRRSRRIKRRCFLCFEGINIQPNISSLTSIKDKKGNNKSTNKIVKGQSSSLSATKKGELYEANMNRSFIVAINESEEQTEKIISYQNRRNAGEIDTSVQEKAIQNLDRFFV